MQAKEKSSIISFLNNSIKYAVLHETSVSKNNLEHYFILITLKDTKDSIIEIYLREYEKKYPLIDLSRSSLNYLKEKKDDFHFIYIDTLNKDDVFFLEKEKLLKENTHNILSIRLIGETVDLPTHIEVNLEKYIKQAKELSFSIGFIAKEEITKGIRIGLDKIREKSPVIKNGFNKIKNKIKG